MDFDEIDRFIEAADAGSFSAAADKLNITPQGLGHSVRKLEEELGLSLLDKNSQGVVLTRTGKNVYSHFMEIKKHMARIQALSDIENRKNIRLRCAYKPSNIGNKVADKLMQLKDIYLFDLEMIECVERGAINEACSAGICDIAFTYERSFEPIDRESWVKYDLFAVEHIPYVNSASSVAGLSRPRLSDMNDMIMAFHNELGSSWTRKLLLRFFEDNGLEQYIGVESGSMHSTVEFISRNTNVVTFLPSTFDRNFLNSFANVKRCALKEYPKTVFCAFVHKEIGAYDKIPLIADDLRSFLKASAVHE